jgi:hypothetical protein
MAEECAFCLESLQDEGVSLCESRHMKLCRGCDERNRQFNFKCPYCSVPVRPVRPVFPVRPIRPVAPVYPALVRPVAPILRRALVRPVAPILPGALVRPVAPIHPLVQAILRRRHQIPPNRVRLEMVGERVIHVID